MNTETKKQIQSTWEILLYQDPNGQTEINVKFENDTVWLNQKQMSELFDRDRTVINRHINNVFKEGELDKKSNVHFLHVPNSDRPLVALTLLVATCDTSQKEMMIIKLILNFII